MLGELSLPEIDILLKQQVTGRIACVENGVPYIVPVNYFYDGKSVLSHSAPGKKIDIMRNNPAVCFQVDDIQNIFHWQSVVAWGRFEEITEMGEKEQAMQAIIHRIMPFSINPHDHPSHGIAESEYDIGTKIDLVLYRIVLIKKTGRFEHR